MTTGWTSYPIDFSGGWITNQSRLEQGSNYPGSATILTNLEPSINGGYAKIRGYSKFSQSPVPGTGRIIGVAVADEGKIIAFKNSTYYHSSGTAWNLIGTVPNGGSVRLKHTLFNFDGTPKMMFVDGVNKPAVYNTLTNSLTVQTSAPSDLQGCSLVTQFKNHIFLANNYNLIFTAPFLENDYTPGNGGGIINTGGRITGLIVFRDQLIIFHTNKIFKLVGSSLADFDMQPIAMNMGCLCPHTVQEVGGDIMYLGPDGVRWLSSTERLNDFGLERASEAIQPNLIKIVNTNCLYSSITIRHKNQYRLFSYIENIDRRNSQGFIATKFSDQSTSNIEWASLKGFKIYSADSFQSRDNEVIVFSSDTNFVYRMESGNSFDGATIPWEFETPYMAITDPRLRKTFYKHSLYVKSGGKINILCSMKLDYGKRNIIQPPPFDISSGTEGIYYYGDSNSTYGTAIYSTRPSTLLVNNLVGSGYTVAFNYSGEDSEPSFLLENSIIEYAENGRR